MRVFGCTIFIITGLTWAQEPTASKQDTNKNDGAISNVNQRSFAPPNQFSPFAYQNTQIDTHFGSIPPSPQSIPTNQAPGNDLSGIQLGGSVPGIDSFFNFPGFINNGNVIDAFGNFNSFVAGPNVPITPVKEVRVPQPYPVYVPKPVPVQVQIRVPVEVPKPYPVRIPHPVPVPVQIRVPVPVEKPYPVTITRTIAIPVEKPVYIRIPQIIQEGVPHPYPVTIPKGSSAVLPPPGFLSFDQLASQQLSQFGLDAVQINTPSTSLGQEIQIGGRLQSTSPQGVNIGSQQNKENTVPSVGATEAPVPVHTTVNPSITADSNIISPEILSVLPQINEIFSSSTGKQGLEFNGEVQQANSGSQANS